MENTDRRAGETEEALEMRRSSSAGTCVDEQWRKDLSSKWHLLPITRRRSPNTPAHTSWYWSCHKQLSTGWIDVTQKKRHIKISFSSSHQSIMASRSLLTADAKALAFTHPFCSAERKTPSLPCSGQIQLRGEGARPDQVPYDTHLSRTKRHTLSLKQEKTFPHKATSPTQAARTLYLLIRKCPRLKAHSYGTNGGQKTACTRLPFLMRPKWTTRWKYGSLSRDQHGT